MKYICSCALQAAVNAAVVMGHCDVAPLVFDMLVAQLATLSWVPGDGRHFHL